MRFSEQFVNVPVLKPADQAAGADGESIHFGRLHTVSYNFLFGSVTGDAVLKFYRGATAGTKTTAIDFKYRLADAAQAAAGADQYGNATAVTGTSGLTLTAATFANKQMIIEFDAQAVDDGTPWVTPEISAVVGAKFISCSAIGAPRQAGNDPLTVI